MTIRRTLCGIGVAVFWLATASMVNSASRTDGIPGQVPNYQYANIAPLPGAGVAINTRGELDGNGALQTNIPVAYTPGWGYASLNAFKGAHPVQDSPEFSNGSGIVALGFFNHRRIFISGMQVSKLRNEAKAYSGQVAILDETATVPAVSIGMQDVLRKEIYGRSGYIVLTKSIAVRSQKLYATLGYGSGRFLNKPFAGMSLPVGGNLNFATEWDGFQLNNGIAWRPGGRQGKFTTYTGYNGKAGILMGGSFAFDFSK